MNGLRNAVLAFLAAIGLAGPAHAHPHVLVTAKVELVFDDAARLSAVRHIWQFDEAFSAYAVQGLDTNNDNILTRAELAPLSRINVESLAEYEFFTWLDVDGIAEAFVPPQEYWLDIYDGRLTLFYTLPLAEPAAIAGSSVLRVFDPEYYVAIDYAPEQPVALINAPASCAVDFRPPGELDPQTAAVLATIPAEQRALPANLAGITAQWANSFTVSCGAATPTPVAAAAPAELTAGGGPLGIAPPETGGGANWGGPLAPLLAKIAAWQSDFYSRLTASLGELDENFSALWLLLGLSFLYGVFHAAGPGHGKAVITAYLLASGETLRRGVVIAFAAAFVQATVAILLAAIVFWILNRTASAMTSVTNVLEIGSYALIVAIGIWLLWTRIRGHRHVHAHALGAAAVQPGDNHAPHHHDHDHHGHAHHDHAGHDHHDHGHSHAPDPRRLGERLTFASAWTAILAVGIRPCTGALIVLSFALAQGLFLAGVASTLVMAVGTGLTVAALATLAVVARDAALRLTSRRSATIAVVGRTIEIGGALAVLVLGLLLLGGALSAAA